MAAVPEAHSLPKILTWPACLVPASGVREDALRATDMPKSETSVLVMAKSPVSRLTVPGPILSSAAPSAARSTVALSVSLLPAALFGPVKSALIWATPSGLTVLVAFHVSAALLPWASGSGHAVMGWLPLTTSPTGIGAHASASDRRHEKVTASNFAP